MPAPEQAKWRNVTEVCGSAISMNAAASTGTAHFGRSHRLYCHWAGLVSVASMFGLPSPEASESPSDTIRISRNVICSVCEKVRSLFEKGQTVSVTTYVPSSGNLHVTVSLVIKSQRAFSTCH